MLCNRSQSQGRQERQATHQQDRHGQQGWNAVLPLKPPNAEPLLALAEV